MFFTLAVLAAAIGTSLVRGGRLRHLADNPLRASWLLFAALGAQLAAEGLARASGHLAMVPTYPLLLASHAALVAWLVMNRRRAASWLVATGLALNAVVIAANGAMPVDPAALAVLGHDGAPLDAGKHMLMDDTTRLAFLGDIWAIGWLRSVISVGDVALAVGMIPFVHDLMTPQPVPRRARD